MSENEAVYTAQIAILESVQRWGLQNDPFWNFHGQNDGFSNSPGGLVGYSLDKPLQVPRLKHGTLVMVIHAIMGILRLHYESLGMG